MTRNWKRNTKKYIAGILTIALAAGVCQSYGSMEVSAQESTLPGIKKLVQDTVASTDGTFHILEIVPSKQDASIGYLIGGEEPIKDGRKLSELPAASERVTAMSEIAAQLNGGSLANIVGSNGPVSFSSYSESTTGTRTEEIRGSFIKNTDNQGNYTFVQTEPVYVLYSGGADSRERFNRYGSLEVSDDSNDKKPGATPIFAPVNGSITTANLEMEIVSTTAATQTALAADQYALNPYNPDGDNQTGAMSGIISVNFNADSYIGREVYQKDQTSGKYSYLGKIVYGTDLPSGYTVQNIQDSTITAEPQIPVKSTTGSVSENDINEIVSTQSISGNDASTRTVVADPERDGENVNAESPVTYAGNDADISKNLYILNLATKQPVLWAKWERSADGTESYILTPPGDCYLLSFEKNSSGEYYISQVTISDDGDYRLIESYIRDDNGKYVMESEGTLNTFCRGESGFSDTDNYDFIGDDTQSALGTVTYDGGFYNKEWFKKEVLNLSGTSRYENGASSGAAGDINSLKIEVTTLTLAELADLTDPDMQAYYGINLDDVDLIYLSGHGTYGSEPKKERAVAVAQMIAKKAFGIVDDAGNRSDSSRVPVIMDYGFYAKNLAAGNKVMTNLALTLLRVSDTSTRLAQNIATKDGFWTKGLDDKGYINDVNTIFQNAGDAAGVTDASSLTLGSLKEFLTENVYLYNDSDGNLPYVASDYLTELPADSGRAWIYGAVVKEIQYENFLAEKSGSTEAHLSEKITKASITRYVLNWYMHRVTVKSSVRVLDLEPCYDTSAQTSLTVDHVKELMGRTAYGGEIDIVKMPSAEFIGKVEDLNEKYDMIYLGAQVGSMNTDASGNTVYNDSRMNGLIYSHLGDYYDYSGQTPNEQERLGDISVNHKINDNSSDLNNNTNVYRGPGNDMNSTRYNEFMQYVKAGYPVIIADKYLNILSDGQTTASSITLDKNSYFYKIVDFMVTSKNSDGEYLYWQKNVYAESQLLQEGSNLQTSLTERQNTFCNYLNLSKLSVDWVTTLGESPYPTALNYGNKQEQAYQNSLEPIDGKYQLQYIFTLSNDADASPVTTTYDCKLFVDKNADGRFAGSDYVEGQTISTSEELTGLSVYVRKGSEWQTVEAVMDSGTSHYELRVGNIYKVIRQLPDDYVGAIPWKLVLYDNADRLVRTAQSGYTAVPQQNGKKQIKILQLLSEKDNKWNLEDDLKDSGSDFYKYIYNLKDWEITVKSITVTQLLETELNIPSYMNSDEAIEECYNKSYQYMQQYNMLILGFADTYRFGYQYRGDSVRWSNTTLTEVKKDMAVAQAVCSYIESGKSVLFTHDTTSYIGDVNSINPWAYYEWSGWQRTADTNSWYWGYEINRSIRASVGLDRYGALQNYYAEQVNATSYEPTKQRYQNYLDTLNGFAYDEIKEPNTDQSLGQIEGLTKYTVVRFLRGPLEELRTNRNYTAMYFPIKNSLLYDAGYREASDSNKASNMLKGTYGKDEDSELALKATQVNEGQITQYPYLISKDEEKSLKVSATHYQWYQPNMELDRDGDGKNDIVVWYCLSDIYNNKKYPTNIYNVCPNDVVNNYYIYNMRNVTYSGAGHSKPDSGAEMKLFVNTMIAAYNAGVTAPSVSFKDDKDYDLNSIYVISDPVNNLILTTKNQGNVRSTENGDVVSVNFKAEDDNILTGNPQVCVEFYKSAGNASNPQTVEGIAEQVVPLSVSSVKDSAGNAIAVKDGHYEVVNNTTCTLTYPLSEMGLFNADSGEIRSDAEATRIYVRVYTLFENGTKVTPSSSDNLTISAQELFELN